jgi:hypothetical protein
MINQLAQFINSCKAFPSPSRHNITTHLPPRLDILPPIFLLGSHTPKCLGSAGLKTLITKVRRATDYQRGQLFPPSVTFTLYVSSTVTTFPHLVQCPHIISRSLTLSPRDFNSSPQRLCHGFRYSVSHIHCIVIKRVCTDRVEPCVPTPPRPC